ncbi:MAG: hypothetical protein ACYC2O_10820 [Microthrixaceae bacterium]
MIPRRRRSNVVIGVVLFAGLVLALGLIILGGGDGSPDPTSTSTSPTSEAATTAPAAPGVTLPLDDLATPTIEELTGLALPEDMTEFFTARLDGDTQLDVTFVMPEAAVAPFIAESGLPRPVADERLVLHSSPLWKVNPDEGTTLSSTQDERGSVHRVVELLGDGSGTIRARIVITPA